MHQKIVRVRTPSAVRPGKRAYGNYLLALLLFGSNGVVASRIGLSSYEIVLLRALLGSCLLVGIFFLTGRQLSALRHKRDLFFIAMSGIAMAADWLFLFEAYAQIGVSLGMLINYCGPAIVVALSPLLFRERITLQKGIALGAALIGAFLISGQAAITGINTWGLLCAVLSAFAYAAMVICSKKAKQIQGIENATVQLFFTFVTVAVFVGCKQGFRISIESGEWLSILWLGLINTGAGCFLYFSSIGRLPVQTVALCGYLEPLSAILLAVIFLHETMLPLQLLGAVLIIGGAILGECTFSAHRIRGHNTKGSTHR